MSTAQRREHSEWVSTAEATAILGRSARTVRRWAARDTWRTELVMLPGGRAPARFYAKADVLASLRADAGHVAAGAVVGVTADGAQGAPLPAVLQRLEVLQGTLDRFGQSLEATLHGFGQSLEQHRHALDRNSAALERRDLRSTWLDVWGLPAGALVGGLVALLALLLFVLATASP